MHITPVIKIIDNAEEIKPVIDEVLAQIKAFWNLGYTNPTVCYAHFWTNDPNGILTFKHPKLGLLQQVLGISVTNTITLETLAKVDEIYLGKNPVYMVTYIIRELEKLDPKPVELINYIKDKIVTKPTLVVITYKNISLPTDKFDSISEFWGNTIKKYLEHIKKCPICGRELINTYTCPKHGILFKQIRNEFLVNKKYHTYLVSASAENKLPPNIIEIIIESESITQPPVTQPSVTQPLVTQPPVIQPSFVIQPPVTQSSVTQPPVTQPSVTQPSVTQQIDSRVMIGIGLALLLILIITGRK